MKYIRLIIIALFLLPSGVYSQWQSFAPGFVQPEDSLKNLLISTVMNTTNNSNLPQITPLSPEASGLGRYGEHGVSLYNGIADISIPLFEIKTKNFTVPIVLRYCASGIKVTDVASWVGLGWNLDVGGQITRKVMGSPDENNFCSKPIKDANQISYGNVNDRIYIHNIIYESLDSEPDIYSYSFLGKSGRFLANNANPDQAIMIPFAPYKIDNQLLRGGPQKPINIIDEKGNLFEFKDREMSYTDGNGLHATAWKLSRIISQDKTDSVVYSYLANRGSTYDVTDYVKIETNYLGLSAISNHDNYMGLQTTGCLPQEIQFATGKIKFRIISGREDNNPNFQVGENYLQQMEIYSTNSINPERIIQFQYGYFEYSSHKRLRLNAIKVQDSNSNLVEEYKFEYNTHQNLPHYFSRSKDLWGYYNGQSNSTLVPGTEVYLFSYTGGYYKTIGGADRSSNSDCMQAWVLNKITYPTKGYTTFEYEANRYDNKYAGGLRIKKMASYFENGQPPLIKSYKYGENESGNGTLNVDLSQHYFTYDYLTSTLSDPCLVYKNRIYYSNSSLDIVPYEGSPVGYSTVTEYAGDGTDINGKTVYTFTQRRDYTIDISGMSKKHTMSFSSLRGLLSSKVSYKYNSSNRNFEEIHRIENEYQYFPEKHYELNALYVKLNWDYPGDPKNSYDPPLASDPKLPWGEDRGMENFFYYLNYPITAYDNLLKKTVEESTFEDNKKVKKETIYDYNSNCQLIKETTIGSDNKQIIVKSKFPNDFAGIAVTDTMISRNMLGVKIEQQSNVGNSEVLKEKSNYILFNGNGAVVLSNLQKTYKGIETITEYTCDLYDPKANIRQTTDKSGLTSVYLWGYNYQYLIAEIKGKSYSDIETVLGSAAINALASNNNPNVESLSSQLRNAFQSEPALVTCYAYKPLVGISLVIDPRGVKTFYEYDDLGRLIWIKDHNGNIIETYDYHYQNQ